MLKYRRFLTRIGKFIRPRKMGKSKQYAEEENDEN